jgi:uncharacterized protein (DUF885 family)
MATTTVKPIQEIYSEGMSEVNKIIAQGDAAQREVAEQTLDDLTAMMLAFTLNTVQERTALLTGLINELRQVIEAVETDPPYANAVKGLTRVIDIARTRLTKEKKDLLPEEG